MRNKGLLIVTAALAVAAGAVLLVDGGSGKGKDERIGRVVLPAAEGAALERVTIGKAERTVTLAKDASGVWRIGGPDGFPADAQRVLRLVDELGRAKYTMLASSKSEKQGEFGLDAATTLELQSAGKTSLALRLGDSRQGGGVWAGVPGESRIYLVDPAPQVPVDEEPWELRTLVSVDRGEVRTVVFFPEGGGSSVTIGRDKKEDPLKVVGLAETQVEKPAAQSVDGILAGVTFAKRLDPSNEQAKTALAKPSKAFVTLFDGRTYEVRVGSVADKWYLEVHADKNGAALDAKAEAELAQLARLMATNAFEVPAHVAQRFARKPDEFYEARPEG